MTTRTVVEGQWTYTISSGVSATNGSQTISAVDMVEARRLVYEASRHTNPRITIVSGPGRALSARRFTRSLS